MTMTSAKPKGFQCKQFFVAHDQCAMKVSTDSLILGSFVNTADAKAIIDVGTGCGILALMLAQKSPPDTSIVAIDIDQAAITQATQNVSHCPWPKKISVVHSALQNLGRDKRFDLIVSNPPYFANATNSTRAYESMALARGQARTEQALSIERFFAETALLSTRDSQLYCMYPLSRQTEVLRCARQAGWHVRHLLAVQHGVDSAPYLGVYGFVREETKVDSRTLIIRNKDNQYTDAYRTLCKDFYLHF